MTEPKNELPEFHKGFRPCKQCEYTAPPELKKSERKHFDAHVFECTRCLWTPEAMPTLDKAREAWNTRPAKAVQGNKAEALEIFDQLFDEHGNIKEDAPVEHWPHRIRAALTPESEGIAGKVDFAAMAFRLIKQMGEPETDGRSSGLIFRKGKEYVFISDFDIAAIESTLARPQEIDEPPELPDRSNAEACAKFANDCAWWMERNRKYLSAPDGKAQKGKECK